MTGIYAQNQAPLQGVSGPALLINSGKEPSGEPPQNGDKPHGELDQ